jgi:peptide/nickel transport system permease protein
LIRYAIRRVLLLIPILLAVSIIVYVLLDLAPGSVVDGMISGNMTQEDIAELEHKYNLDKPVLYRYGLYMVHLVQGDLGKSDYTGLDVWEIYITRLPNTLILALTSLIFGSVIGIPLGILSARRAGTLVDNAITFITLLGMSMPGFWLALLFIIQFSLKWPILPAGGYDNGFASLVLPTICSGFVLMAGAARQTRASMLEQLNADYLRTARAKGVPEEVVINKHALGNAWIPILTMLGGALCASVAGSAIVEYVFSWPGVGRTAVEAVISRDVTMTMGCTIMTTAMYVLIMLAVDLLYAFVDPRIKSMYASPGRKRRRAA